jgi:hypothetical protein
MTKKEEAIKDFMLCLRTHMTDKKLNNSINKLLEKTEQQSSVLGDKYNTPYGVKVSKAVEKKNKKLYDEAHYKLYKAFKDNPIVQEFLKKVSTTCGDTYKRFRAEKIKDINRDIANLKKYLTEEKNVESKEFLTDRLNGAEEKKQLYKMDPKLYSSWADEKSRSLYSLCSLLTVLLRRAAM